MMRSSHANPDYASVYQLLVTQSSSGSTAAETVDAFLKQHNIANFKTSEFVKWAASARLQEKRHASSFHAFPFLRDDAFLHYARTLQSSIPHPSSILELESFLLHCQLKYHQECICPQSDVRPASSPAIPASCPFAQNRSTGRFILTDIGAVQSTTFNSGSIKCARTATSAPSILIAPPGLFTAPPPACKAIVFDGKMQVTLPLPSTVLLFGTPNACFDLSSAKSGNSVIDALSRLRDFTTADMKFLFPASNISCTESTDRIINILIFSLALDNEHLLQAMGTRPFWTGCSQQPSILEPYADVLTAEFVHENTDLFRNKIQ